MCEEQLRCYNFSGITTFSSVLFYLHHNGYEDITHDDHNSCEEMWTSALIWLLGLINFSHEIGLFRFRGPGNRTLFLINLASV